MSSLDDRTALRLQIDSLASVIHGFQVSLDELRRRGEASGLSTANLQQAVSAAVNLSKELRQVEALDLERARTRGELVARGAAETVVRRAVEGMTTTLESLRQDVAEALASAGCSLGEMAGGAGSAGGSGGAEAFERWAYAKLEPLFDAARARVADELAAEGQAAEVAGGGREAA